MRTVHRTRQNHPMSAEAQTANWIGYLEDRAGSRDRAARNLHVTPGYLENLRRGRIKRLTLSAYEKIRAATIKELEKEIAELENELAIARLSAVRPDEDQVFAAMANIQEARKALGKLAG